MILKYLFGHFTEEFYICDKKISVESIFGTNFDVSIFVFFLSHSGRGIEIIDRSFYRLFHILKGFVLYFSTDYITFSSKCIFVVYVLNSVITVTLDRIVHYYQILTFLYFTKVDFKFNELLIEQWKPVKIYISKNYV